MKPKVTFAGTITLWLVSDHGRGSSYRVFEGARTVRAVARALHTEERAGRAAHLELETAACGPVVFDLSELVGIGIVQDVPADEHAVVVARAALAGERKGPKRTPRFLEGLAKVGRGGKWLGLLLIALSLAGCGSVTPESTVEAPGGAGGHAPDASGAAGAGGAAPDAGAAGGGGTIGAAGAPGAAGGGGLATGGAMGSSQAGAGDASCIIPPIVYPCATFAWIPATIAPCAPAACPSAYRCAICDDNRAPPDGVGACIAGDRITACVASCSDCGAASTTTAALTKGAL